MYFSHITFDFHPSAAFVLRHRLCISKCSFSYSSAAEPWSPSRYFVANLPMFHINFISIIISRTYDINYSLPMFLFRPGSLAGTFYSCALSHSNFGDLASVGLYQYQRPCRTHGFQLPMPLIKARYNESTLRWICVFKCKEKKQLPNKSYLCIATSHLRR